jgi:5S rRNA maturation endonuclease (ribonuclease M5)
MSSVRYLDLDTVKAAAKGRWWDIVSKLANVNIGLLDGKHHPCPKCEGKDRFRVFDDFRDTGGVFCNQCHSEKNADGFATLRWLNDWKLPTAIAKVAEVLDFQPTALTATDLLRSICREKNMPVPSALAYGAEVRGNGLQFPMYGPDGQQCSEFTIARGSKGYCAKGKPAGVFLPLQNGSVQAPRMGEQWVIVEGVKDAVALHSLGYRALGTHGCKLSVKHSTLMKGVDCIIVPDLDEPGIAGAKAMEKRLSQIARTVRVASLPGKVESRHGADVRDILKMPDGERAVRNAINVVSMSKSELIVVSADEMKYEEVGWMWTGYLPQGHLAILEGDPGVGKTFVYCDWAARLTTGRAMPSELDGGWRSEPANVIILNDEDAHSQVLNPRIAACGGDLKRVQYIQGVGRPDERGETASILQLPSQIGLLEERIRQRQVKLVVIENVATYFDPGLSESFNQDLRKVLIPLCKLASDSSCSILLVRHLRKSDSTATTQGMGSIAYYAVARSVLVIGTDPAEQERQILAVAKASFSAKPPSLALEISGSGREAHVEWLGQSDVSADDLATHARRPGARRKTKPEQAYSLILERTQLGSEVYPVKELEEAARQAGIGDFSLRQGRKLAELRDGIVSETLGFQGPSYLGTPELLTQKSSEMSDEGEGSSG